MKIMMLWVLQATLIVIIQCFKPFFKISFSYNFFFSSIKMPKNLSARYYWKKKQGKASKKPAKGIKIFQKKQKTKSENTVGNDISIS